MITRALLISRTTARLCATWVCLALAALFARAQDTPTPISSALHVNSRLVVLDVVVTGKEGELISGLTKKDFHIVEDADPQTIRSLQYVASTTVPASHSKSVLILDELNNSIEETSYAKSELKHYIATLPEILQQPTMLVAVDDTGLRELVSSTRDRQALETSLRAESSKIPSDFQRRDYQARFRTSVNALWQIARASEGSSGRTELIWVGHGFPGLNTTNMEGDSAADIQTLIQNLSNALLNSRAVLYKIDPAPVGAGNMNASIDNTEAVFDDSVEPFSDSISFDTLVRQTGGHSFFNRNDVDAEVSRAISLGSTFYTLSYTPTHPAGSMTEYRHIHLTVDSPGAHATTRLGYFTAQSKPAHTANPFMALDAAMTSGLDYGALRINVLHCADSLSTSHGCRVQIDPEGLSWTTAPDGSSTATLLTSAAFYSKIRKPLSYHRESITLHRDSSRPSFGKISFELSLQILDEAASLRVVVFEPATGKLGSTNISLGP